MGFRNVMHQTEKVALNDHTLCTQNVEYIMF